MKKLVCDVCGGEIEMQEGGEKGRCVSCGLSYSLNRMKEIYSGMKVSVTGTDEDVEQWKSLLTTYLRFGDYNAAEGIVKKILGAKPDDAYGNEVYFNLQDWKHFNIKNGVLVKYNGKATNIKIPQSVVEIGEEAFSERGIKSVVIPECVTRIGDSAFSCCSALEEVCFSDGLKSIGKKAFEYCSSLTKIVLPESLEEIGYWAFVGCGELSEITIPDSVQRIDNPFLHCRNLRDVKASLRVRMLLGKNLVGSEQSKLWSDAGFCECCGGKLNAMFTCVECGHTNEDAFPSLLNTAYDLLCKARNKPQMYLALMQHFGREEKIYGRRTKGFSFKLGHNDIWLHYKHSSGFLESWYDGEKSLYLRSENIVDAINFIKKNI